MEYGIITILASSLGIGLLVGLQREYDDHKIAGIRTFTLATLLGTLTALLSQYFNSEWIIVIGFFSLTILLSVANFMKKKIDKESVGQTTEVALLLMYGVGAYLVYGELSVGVGIGALTAVLLHLKGVFGDFVNRLAYKDIRAIMQFVAISLVILPILPDKTYGPYEVLNPREIWLMVVLIVGLSLIGYFLYKWLGEKTGSITNGILGGLISSTATTVTFARRSKEAGRGGRLAALIIFMASTVAMIRVLIEVAIISPKNFALIAPPIILEIVFMSIVSVSLYFYIQNEENKPLPEPDNPAQFTSALVFGLLYGVILFLVAVCKDFFGEQGLYFVTVISGLTDVDAITLSLANTVNRGEIEASIAWKFILLASLSNLVFKGVMAYMLGTRSLGKFIIILFGLSLIAGFLILGFWEPI